MNGWGWGRHGGLEQRRHPKYNKRHVSKATVAVFCDSVECGQVFSLVLSCQAISGQIVLKGLMLNMPPAAAAL